MKKILWIVVLILLAGAGFYIFSPEAEKWMSELTTSMIESDAPTIATLHTAEGDIKIQLLPAVAPKLTENFWRLAKEGKYDDSKFHRVIPGFMIQGGDYENGNGTGGESHWGGMLEDEFSDTVSHVRGAVSMANRGADTNGSQFFIVHQNATFLDGRHSIFGQVMEGMDVVDKITTARTDMNDAPLKDIVIQKITLK